MAWLSRSRRSRRRASESRLGPVVAKLVRLQGRSSRTMMLPVSGLSGYRPKRRADGREATILFSSWSSFFIFEVCLRDRLDFRVYVYLFYTLVVTWRDHALLELSAAWFGVVWRASAHIGGGICYHIFPFGQWDLPSKGRAIFCSAYRSSPDKPPE
jgi:hypothetical protein